MRTRIPLIVGTLAVVVLCGAFAISAAAGGGSAKSKVKITEGGPDHFEGKVTSAEDKCERGRKVKLLYQFDGPYPRRGDVVDTAKTNRRGVWEMDGMYTAGLYQAFVPEDEKGDLICRRDRSVRQRF